MGRLSSRCGGQYTPCVSPRTSDADHTQSTGPVTRLPQARSGGRGRPPGRSRVARSVLRSGGAVCRVPAACDTVFARGHRGPSLRRGALRGARGGATIAAEGPSLRRGAGWGHLCEGARCRHGGSLRRARRVSDGIVGLVAAVWHVVLGAS